MTTSDLNEIAIASLQRGLDAMAARANGAVDALNATTTALCEEHDAHHETWTRLAKSEEERATQSANLAAAMAECERLKRDLAGERRRFAAWKEGTDSATIDNAKTHARAIAAVEADRAEWERRYVEADRAREQAEAFRDRAVASEDEARRSMGDEQRRLIARVAELERDARHHGAIAAQNATLANERDALRRSEAGKGAKATPRDDERAAWQRATGCSNPETIAAALYRISRSLDKTPTEGIPDAIDRLKTRVGALTVERDAHVATIRSVEAYAIADAKAWQSATGCATPDEAKTDRLQRLGEIGSMRAEVHGLRAAVEVKAAGVDAGRLVDAWDRAMDAGGPMEDYYAAAVKAGTALRDYIATIGAQPVVALTEEMLDGAVFKAWQSHGGAEMHLRRRAFVEEVIRHLGPVAIPAGIDREALTWAREAIVNGVEPPWGDHDRAVACLDSLLAGQPNAVTVSTYDIACLAFPDGASTSSRARVVTMLKEHVGKVIAWAVKP